MDQGLRGRATVHLRLQVQLQMKAQLHFLLTWEMALSAEEPETTAYFVLGDDRGRVAVADAVLVGEPVGALVATGDGGAGFQVNEPLGQLTSRYERDASDEAFVGSGGVRQRHWHLRVGSRFQSRLPHLEAAGKTQSATFPQCPVCRFEMILRPKAGSREPLEDHRHALTTADAHGLQADRL